MKKMYLAALSVVFITSLFGQNQFLTKDFIVINGEQAIKQTSNTALAKEAIIYTNDFSDPSDWTFDNASSPFLDWSIITNVNASPVAALSPLAMTTASNGFAFINSDAAGEGSTQSANIRLANSIDLSDEPLVTINFEQVTRQFDAGYFFIYSIDGGTSWGELEINQNLEVSANSANPAFTTLNVSNLIGGEEDVRIGFRFEGAYDWFWAIDDIAISEAEPAALVMIDAYYDAWFLYLVSPVLYSDAEFIPQFEYSKYLKGQVRPLSFSTRVVNQGSETLNNLIFTATLAPPSDLPVETFTAEGFASLAPGDTALISIEDILPAAFADGGQIGDYTVSFNVLADEEESNVDDNGVADKVFRVDQELMANDKDNYTGLYTTLADDVIWGNRFMFVNETEIDLIQFQIFSNAEFNTGVGEEVYLNIRTGSVFTEEGPDNENNLLFEDEELIYTVTGNDVSNADGSVWITYMLPDVVPVDPDIIYQAEIVVPPAGLPHVYIPVSNGQESSLAGALYDYNDVSSGPQGWFTLGANAPQIRLGNSMISSVNNSAALNFMVGQNFPNPTNGTTRINWELLEPADKVLFMIHDINGKLVYERNLGSRPAGIQEMLELNLSNLAAGSYQYAMQIDNNRLVRKMIIQ